MNSAITSINSFRPFTIFGVDFFGSITTTFRIRGKPPYKPYVTLFVFRSSWDPGEGSLRQCDQRSPKEVQAGGISEFALRRGGEFAFIPPKALHFGGPWEAGVESAKHLFLWMVGNTLLTKDHTLLTLILSRLPRDFNVHRGIHPLDHYLLHL